jgi:small subunit ribosomal protein S4e
MGRKGERKVIKRLNTPKFLQIKRKHGKYFIKASSGPHPSRFSLPLLHIVRDLLKLADDYREAKRLITRGYFKIDGTIINDIKFPVGLMDVLTVEKMKKNYRVLPDSHYGLILHEIPETEASFKLCRINNKVSVKGGHLQLNLHDGRNILIRLQDPRSPKEDIYKRMDVLKISVPDQEILKVLKFKESNLALIISGKNIGQVGTIKNINILFGPKASTVSIQHDSQITETLFDYTFIIGETQSEINLPKEIK